MDRVIITVDLGHFRAYGVTRKPLESPHLELIESYDSTEAHGKLSEKYSDADGRFGLMGGKGKAATGNGEAHNIILEAEKKMIKGIAGDIEKILLREDGTEWYFAAPAGINSRIVERLSAGAKARLGKNITANLTKKKKAEILSFFE
jgi:hypothetical protein